MSSVYVCDETVTETVKRAVVSRVRKGRDSVVGSEADRTSTAELTSKSCLQFSLSSFCLLKQSYLAKWSDTKTCEQTRAQPGRLSGSEAQRRTEDWDWEKGSGLETEVHPSHTS